MTDLQRVDVFIDGFNFYFGLKESELSHLKWLDWVALARRLNTTRQLGQVFYYTARVTRDPAAATRQSTYLDALGAHCGDQLHIVEGRLQWEPRSCTNCNHTFDLRVEKHTDVNMAADMIARAYEDEYDVAMLISGDADQVAAVRAVRRLGKEVRVVFPPRRESTHLKDAADTAYPVKTDQIERSQLPPAVTTKNNIHLYCPESWK